MRIVWRSAKLTDTVNGYDVTTYERRIPIIPNNYSLSIVFYAKKATIINYDKWFGRAPSEETIWIINHNMQSLEYYPNQDFGIVDVSILLWDDLSIREM